MKYSYALLLVVIMIFFGYTVKNVMSVVDVLNKRVEVINTALQGK